jgi:hypothetical protein
MASLKAPGPDDFVVGFYQENWADISKDVYTAATTFFYHRSNGQKGKLYPYCFNSKKNKTLHV